ncbi:MAG: hypothetical protein H7Y59_05600 [Anaerolineales bacterium]|nr:hypothetical protein [Anaerolineales bacterium]
MQKTELPEDLIEFLISGSQLDYDPDDCECGHVTLLAHDKLTPSVVFVDSDDAPFANQDPHAEEEGCYVIPAINLVAECEGYDPDGILIWLPDQKVFGTWDSEYWDVLIFPYATWRDISTSPVKYLNALWDQDAVLCEYLRPFPNYPFQPE